MVCDARLIIDIHESFLLYRKLRRISYKAKKRSAWIALRRNRICRFATRRRRRILRSRILFLCSFNSIGRVTGF